MIYLFPPIREASLFPISLSFYPPVVPPPFLYQTPSTRPLYLLVPVLPLVAPWMIFAEKKVTPQPNHPLSYKTQPVVKKQLSNQPTPQTHRHEAERLQITQIDFDGPDATDIFDPPSQLPAPPLATVDNFQAILPANRRPPVRIYIDLATQGEIVSENSEDDLSSQSTVESHLRVDEQQNELFFEWEMSHVQTR